MDLRNPLGGFLPANNNRIHGELQQALAMGVGIGRTQAIDEIKQDSLRRLQKYREGDCDIMLFLRI